MKKWTRIDGLMFGFMLSARPGTMLGRDGEQLIGEVLNHSETRTTEVYARLTEDVTREALERHVAKERILRDRLGIRWRSPAELNPGTIFD